jgi:hypothetical protein
MRNSKNEMYSMEDDEDEGEDGETDDVGTTTHVNFQQDALQLSFDGSLDHLGSQTRKAWWA